MKSSNYRLRRLMGEARRGYIFPTDPRDLPDNLTWGEMMNGLHDLGGGRYKFEKGYLRFGDSRYIMAMLVIKINHPRVHLKYPGYDDHFAYAWDSGMSRFFIDTRWYGD